MPPGPVMVHVEAPVLEPGGDALLAADGIQLTGGGQQSLFPGTLADDHDALLIAVHIHVEVILRNVGQVEDGAVVVDQIVAVVTEEFLVVVQSGDGEAGIEQVGTAVVQVGSVHGTHGSAEGHDAVGVAVGLIADVVDGGHQLQGDVAEPVFVVFDTAALVTVQVSPGFVVDGVTGNDHYLTGFDPGSPGLVHVEALKVPEPAGLAGDEQNGAAGMAVDLKFHLAVQMAAPVLFVANFHKKYISPKNVGLFIKFRKCCHPERPKGVEGSTHCDCAMM